MLVMFSCSSQGTGQSCGNLGSKFKANATLVNGAKEINKGRVCLRPWCLGEGKVLRFSKMSAFSPAKQGSTCWVQKSCKGKLGSPARWSFSHRWLIPKTLHHDYDMLSFQIQKRSARMEWWVCVYIYIYTDTYVYIYRHVYMILFWILGSV